MTPQQPTDGKASDQDRLAIRRGLRVFSGSLAVTAMCALAIAVGLMVAGFYYPIETIQQAIESAKGPLAVWRIGLFVAIIGGWPRWSVLYAAWAGLSGAQLALMLSYRWRMALWLLVMEAVLSHRVLGHFIDNLFRV